MKKQGSIWIIPFVALAITSCGRSGGGTAPAAATAPPPPARTVVVFFDVSSSYYSFIQRALQFLAELFKASARAGDIWVFRRINFESYADSASIPVYQGRAMVCLPAVVEPPRNPFNLERRERYLAEQQAFERVRDAVVQGILQAQLKEETRGTDIYGALRKAADLKATHILLFTDLEDNQSRRTDINLNGATVYVVLLHRADVAKSTETRARWEAELKQMNAGKVVFLDLDHNPAAVLEVAR